MSGTIVVDRIESDASYASNINIASPVIVSNTFAFPAGSAAAPAITPTGDTNTGIFFPAADTIAFAEGGTEAMRIDSSGRVGIGTSAPAVQLEVVNPTSGDCAVNSRASNDGNAAGFRAVANNAAGAAYNFFMSQAGATENFYIGGNGNNNTIVFGTGSSRTERARIDGDGLKFNGDTAAANALDDYEEGTYTITTNANLTPSTTYHVWRYIKIGNFVQVNGLLLISSVSGSDAVSISVPFNSAGSVASGGVSYVAPVMYNGPSVGNRGLIAYMNTGASSFVFYNLNDNGSWSQLNNSALTSNDELYVTFTYQSA